jgi:protoporphyrinogen/coproporphyrinogen III oxidase
MRVVVVGGGVAGLATAHRLLELDPSVDVTVLEASGRAGGLVATERTGDGFVIERGPDAILTEKPAAVRLAERLGLAPRMVSTRQDPRGAYVVARGRLERVPEGFSLLAPTAFGPFVRSPVLSCGGKVRALAEPLVPRARAARDESLASFVERRFGGELLDRLAQPLVSGIYGTDARHLSLGATMPRFMEAERTHGSVIRGLRARMRRASSGQGSERASGARYGLFVSFEGGLQVLVDALLERLGRRVRTGAQVVGLDRGGHNGSRGPWRVRVRGRRSVPADAVVLALPAWAAADLLHDTDAELARSLHAIRYGSSATVTLAWRRDQIPHPMDAFGFVVPAVEGRSVLACTWASVKWPGRAPAGHELLRVFLGGPERDDVVAASDGALARRARHELRHLMGIEAEPGLTRVDRYVRAMPRYAVGHAARVDRIDAHVGAHPGLALAGNAYRGVGIPDTIRSGEQAAERVLDQK